MYMHIFCFCKGDIEPHKFGVGTPLKDTGRNEARLVACTKNALSECIRHVLQYM